MALYPNGRTDGAAWNRYRFQGIQTHTQLLPLAGSRFNRFYGETWSKLSGTPVGYYAGGSTILPITVGQIASTDYEPVTFTVTASINEGRNIAGSTTIDFTVNGADLLLSALIVGNASMTVTLNDPALGAAVGIQGSTSFSLTPNTPILGALAGLFADATVSINAQGLVTATGNLSGDITPYTELSPENLARAVWNALAAQYAEAGTMGAALNTAGAGGLTPEQAAQLAGTLTLPQFIALK